MKYQIELMKTVSKPKRLCDYYIFIVMEGQEFKKILKDVKNYTFLLLIYMR